MRVVKKSHFIVSHAANILFYYNKKCIVKHYKSPSATSTATSFSNQLKQKNTMTAKRDGKYFDNYNYC